LLYFKLGPVTPRVLPAIRREVASKQEALKGLVGDRYPDLMESVDDTIAMFHTVENLQKLLADLHTVRSVP
jgi:hypothetical protein